MVVVLSEWVFNQPRYADEQREKYHDHEDPELEGAIPPKGDALQPFLRSSIWACAFESESSKAAYSRQLACTTTASAPPGKRSRRIPELTPLWVCSSQ